MASYRIDRTIPGNQRTFTNRAITRGERIHDEAPLIKLNVAVHHIFDATTFYNPADDHNGVEAILRAYRRITDNNITQHIRRRPLGRRLARTEQRSGGVGGYVEHP